MKKQLLTLLICTLLTGCTSDTERPEVYISVSDAQGTWWAGTKDGLYHRPFGDDTFHRMPLPSLTHHPFPCIYALYCDSVRERLWVGAWNHLYCYDLRKKRFITTRDSSIYETVRVMSDSTGRVLAMTGHGMYRYTLTDSLPGGEQTEQIDSTHYPKLEYANIDITGWRFEQSRHESNLLPWLVGIAIVVLAVFLLLLSRQRNKRVPVLTASTVPLPTDADTANSQSIQTPPRPRFIDQAQKVVDAHLSDENFSIDQMASELAVSRAQLFRKMKAANGQTPKEFVNERRMARAAELLTTTNKTTAVIAGMVGYSDASNFRRAFVQTFGMNPSEYTRQRR